MTRRQIRSDLLSGPTTIENPGFRITEAPFQIWDNTTVSRLSSEIIRVLNIELMICASYICLVIARLEVFSSLPKIGAPFPLSSIGCPCANWERFLILRKLGISNEILEAVETASARTQMLERCILLFWYKRAMVVWKNVNLGVGSDVLWIFQLCMHTFVYLESNSSSN